MFDHIVGLLLIGLGIKTPFVPQGSVKGDTTEVRPLMLNKQDEVKRASDSPSKLLLRPTLIDRGGKTASGPGKPVPSLAKEYIEKRKALQEQFLKDVEAKREAAKEQFETQREAFKKRLETIKDAKKKDLVAKADTRLSEINTKRTKVMSEHVNRIEETITKISDKLAVLQSAGQDVSSVQTKLSQAQAMVPAVKSAISAQATKEYIIGVTTEANLGKDVGRAMEALEKDLKAVQDSIASLRANVQDAVKALALVYGKTEVGDQ